MRVEAQENLPACPTPEELDHEVLVDKHAALDLVDPQDRGLPESREQGDKTTSGSKRALVHGRMGLKNDTLWGGAL